MLLLLSFLSFHIVHPDECGLLALIRRVSCFIVLLRQRRCENLIINWFFKERIVIVADALPDLLTLLVHFLEQVVWNLEVFVLIKRAIVVHEVELFQEWVVRRSLVIDLFLRLLPAKYATHNSKL